MTVPMKALEPHALVLSLDEEIRHDDLISDQHEGLVSLVIKKSIKEPLVIMMGKQNLNLQVEADTSAELLIFEDGLGSAAANIFVGKEAALRLYILSALALGGTRSLKATLEIGPNAKLAFFDAHVSEGSYCLDADIHLRGVGSELSYAGIHQLRGTGRSATNLTIGHEAAHTTSKQEFRGIYAGFSKGLFLGKVVVGEEAPESSAMQLYKAVLLSENAEAKTRPQLEINNRHIKASHGASIGKLDENALFYLCSRGLSMKEAKSLLVRSMAAEILAHMGEDALARFVAKAVDQAIEQSMVL